MSESAHSGTDGAVVIQTMWRTGGTYLAFMLRERNPVALFYEALHEDYSRFTKQEWDAFAQRGDGLSRGHPEKAFHYLTDFPFAEGAGVRSHRSDFAWRPFVMRADADAPDLRSYLEGLTRHAETMQRRPLFKFCRGFLRQPWLRKALAPKTIYLVRRPAGMLKSYRRFNGGAYFFSGFIRILCLNKHQPAFRPVYDHLVRLNPQFEQLSNDAIHGEGLPGLIGRDAAQDIFPFLWALGLAAHCTGDVLLLDAAELGSGRDAHTRLACAIGEHTGLNASFDDATALDPGEAELLSFSDRARYCDYTRAAIALLAPEADYALLAPELARQLALLAGGV